MPPEVTHDHEETLAGWCQGDAVIEGVPAFLHIADLARPLTPAASALAQLELPENGDHTVVVETQPRGIVVVTQTCDIVRAWSERPYVEVSPLVAVDGEVLGQVRTMQRPRFAFVPALAPLGWVVDLDMTMTLEKAVLASLSRVPGCSTDQERREFAEALARKRRRAAFPDAFNVAIRRLQQRLQEKHAKNSPEGRLAEALREIRVRALPGWDEPEAKLTFFFILKDVETSTSGSKTPDHVHPTEGDYKQVETWVARFDQTDNFRLDANEPWRLCRLADLRADEYVYSDQLDLDRLSDG